MRMIRGQQSSTELLNVANHGSIRKENRAELTDKIALLSDIFDKVAVVDSIKMDEIEVNPYEIRNTGRKCSRDCPLSLDKTGCICKDAISSGTKKQKFMIKGKDAYLVISKPINMSNSIYNIVMIDRVDTSFAFGTAGNIGDEIEKITNISSSLVVDQLTRIYNRKYLEDHNGFWVENAKRTGKEMCLCSIDIDNFKRFNDTFGHDCGDKVLYTLARCMEEAVEGMEDTYPIRVGGDEFLIVCTSGMSKKRFTAVMSKLCTIVKGTVLNLNGTDTSITISAGVGAVLEDNVETYKGLYDSADKALYRAKEAGKNCVR